MSPQTPPSGYRAFGFVLTFAFACGMGWMLYTQVIAPGQQPVVDYVSTGSTN